MHLRHRGAIFDADQGSLSEFFSNCVSKASDVVERYSATDDDDGGYGKKKEDHNFVKGKTWKTRRVYYEQMWEDHEKTGDLDIFRSLQIEEDGGLDTESLLQLWDQPLYLAYGASQVIICLVFNVSFIIYSDLKILSEDHENSNNRFLMGRWFYELIFRDMFGYEKLDNAHLVVGIELIIVGTMLLHCNFNILMAVFEEKPCFRWSRITALFWESLPTLGTFTAMKLLHYVDPWIILHEISCEVAIGRERLRHGRWKLCVYKISWFLLSRSLCFIVGCDAFLVKFREAAEDYMFESDLSFGTLLAATIFLFQVLGIVNLNSVVKTRLFFFIFGGPDCIVTSQERAKETFWKSMAARRIYEVHSTFRFLLIMLNFSDFEIQQLILHCKKPVGQVSSQVPATSCNLETFNKLPS